MRNPQESSEPAAETSSENSQLSHPKLISGPPCHSEHCIQGCKKYEIQGLYDIMIIFVERSIIEKGIFVAQITRCGMLGGQHANQRRTTELLVTLYALYLVCIE